MSLCARCKSADYPALLVASIENCRTRQAADGEDEYESKTLTYQHHDDIFSVQEAGKKCQLCRTIFQAFQERRVSNVELARDLPIVFKSRWNGIEVCYETGKELTNLCDLHWYMPKPNGNTQIYVKHEGY